MSSLLCWCWKRQASGKEAALDAEQPDEAEALKAIVAEDQRCEDSAGDEELCNANCSHPRRHQVDCGIRRVYVPADWEDTDPDDMVSASTLLQYDFEELQKMLKDHRSAIIDEILFLINATRHECSHVDLDLCPELNTRAKEVWGVRANIPDGFAVQPGNNILHQQGDKFRYYGCLTYFAPMIDLEWMARAIVGFWFKAGEPIKRWGIFDGFPSKAQDEFYVHELAPAYAEFNEQAKHFRHQMLNKACRKIGLHIDMIQAVPEYTCGRVKKNMRIVPENLACVTAIFDVPYHRPTKVEVTDGATLAANALDATEFVATNTTSRYHTFVCSTGF